jgi:hypothetical protein
MTIVLQHSILIWWSTTSPRGHAQDPGTQRPVSIPFAAMTAFAASGGISGLQLKRPPAAVKTVGGPALPRQAGPKAAAEARAEAAPKRDKGDVLALALPQKVLSRSFPPHDPPHPPGEPVGSSAFNRNPAMSA